MQRVSTKKSEGHLPPKKMDKESKSIQSGRAAKGGKTKKSKKKLLPRVAVPKIKYKNKTYDQM